MAMGESGGERRGAPWRDPILIGSALLWIGALLALRAVHHAATLPELVCIPFDLVALPGEEIELVARCELRRASGRVERAGIAVDLRRAEEEPGSGRVESGADGLARRAIAAPEEPGATVVLADGLLLHARSALPAPAGLFVILDPARELVIVDTEGVPLAAEGRDADPEGVGAARELGAKLAIAAIAERHAIVLLHAGDPEEGAAIRAGSPWRLPRRIPVIADRAAGEDAAAYRSRQLAEWSRRFGGVVGRAEPGGGGAPSLHGIAGSAAACVAQVGAGLDTIAVGGAACPGARGAAEWRLVPAMLPGGSDPRRP